MSEEFEKSVRVDWRSHWDLTMAYVASGDSFSKAQRRAAEALLEFGAPYEGTHVLKDDKTQGSVRLQGGATRHAHFRETLTLAADGHGQVVITSARKRA